MADAAFGGQVGGVHARAQIEGDLDVAEFHGCIDAMDGHVGGAERCPNVVGVLAEALGCFLCFVEKALRS